VITQKNADIIIIIIILFSVIIIIIIIVMNYSAFSLINGLKIFPVTPCPKKKPPKCY